MHETLAGVAKRALCASPSAARPGDRSDEGGSKHVRGSSYGRPNVRRPMKQAPGPSPNWGTTPHLSHGIYMYVYRCVYEYVNLYIHSHPEVDGMWLHKECSMVLSKIIFYLLQDGCIHIHICISFIYTFA